MCVGAVVLAFKVLAFLPERNNDSAKNTQYHNTFLSVVRKKASVSERAEVISCWVTTQNDGSALHSVCVHTQQNFNDEK